jgi:hypothetical protein
MSKNMNKGLIIAAVCFLAMALLVPVYAQTQSGILQQDRDQDCIPEGPATRGYEEEPPVQAQVEKPEELAEEETLEEDATSIQEQSQTQEQLKDCDCGNEDCEQYQYQFQYQDKYRSGQEED